MCESAATNKDRHHKKVPFVWPEREPTPATVIFRDPVSENVDLVVDIVSSGSSGSSLSLSNSNTSMSSAATDPAIVSSAYYTHERVRPLIDFGLVHDSRPGQLVVESVPTLTVTSASLLDQCRLPPPVYGFDAAARESAKSYKAMQRWGIPALLPNG
jgi:hypothetical protein